MSARDDILAGLRASQDTAVGDATPEQILDAYRAEVLREARAVVGEYVPKGPEHQATAWLLGFIIDRLDCMADEAMGGEGDE